MGHFTMFLILIFNLRMKIILLMIIRGQWYPVITPPKSNNFSCSSHFSRGVWSKKPKLGGWYKRRKITKKDWWCRCKVCKKMCKFIEKVG